MKSDIQGITSHYQDQVEALEAETTTLKSRVGDLETQVRILKSRPEVKVTDPWGVSEFLQNNSEISGNWDHLHDLLTHYQEDAVPPESWDTVIRVAAMDQRKAPLLDFNKRFAEVKAQRAAEEAAKGVRVLDLTRSGGAVSGSGTPASRTTVSIKTSSTLKTFPPPSNIKTLKHSGKSSPKKSGKQRLRKVQRWPSKHFPGIDSVRPAGAQTMVSKDTVHTMPGGVVWKEVRPGLRQALLADIRYGSWKP
ncbi:hypothetical protein V7S43_015427 [Phytophthora oleae]|uniref:Uncharacterized protein n=1 Tax=Phytophthora oleae TaxID=2107226 RepID=A0ABD3F2N8_9STRA